MCLLLSEFRCFERLEYDWNSRVADGTTLKVTGRICKRWFDLMPAEIQPLIQRNKLKVEFLLPPHGRQQKQSALFPACDEHMQTVDSFVPVVVTLEVDSADAGTVVDQRQWAPNDPHAWIFLRDKCERVEISGNLDHPVYAPSFKHRGGADYLPEEHPIGVAADFFHFFLGRLVEGSFDDCIEGGRFAYQIRAASSTCPALFIDNGHERPGFEGLAFIFDKEAAPFLRDRQLPPHFVMRNPVRPSVKLSKKEFRQGIFGSTAELVLLAGEPICCEFESHNESLTLQERKLTVVKNAKVRH